MSVESIVLGRVDGREIRRFRLIGANGMNADVMNYGATLMALRTPDRENRCESVVLGFDELAPYLAGTPYFGATIGRYANRIAGARFTLDGVEHELTANKGRNHLHGGARGFDKVVWDAELLEDGVRLAYVSADGEEGYPGELSVEVVYRLAGRTLSIAYRATTTKPTHVNLTHHSYYNLSGERRSEIGGHVLQIDAGRYTPVDAELIPTGELAPVADTPFDFREATEIGSRINVKVAQIQHGGGYDHNFVLTKPASFARAAVLRDPQNGRTMEIWTTEPGLQFYSGNQLDGSLGFARRTGLCLEPQHFPDSPNRPEFPSTVLRPGEVYASRMELKFGAGR